MNGFGRKSLPKLGFATFDLFAAFLADAFGKVRKKTCHYPGIVSVFTTHLARAYWKGDSANAINMCVSPLAFRLLMPVRNLNPLLRMSMPS